MAVATVAVTPISPGRLSASWGVLGTDDTGTAVLTGASNALTVQVVGADAVVQMQGSNDGSTWVNLEDMNGFGGAAAGAGRMLFFMHVPAYVRPLGIEGVASGVFMSAAAYADDDVRAAVDGTLSPADTTAAIPLADAMTTLRIGATSAGAQWDGHIARIAYRNRRLPNDMLQSLTA